MNNNVSMEQLLHTEKMLQQDILTMELEYEITKGDHLLRDIEDTELDLKIIQDEIKRRKEGN